MGEKWLECERRCFYSLFQSRKKSQFVSSDSFLCFSQRADLFFLSFNACTHISCGIGTCNYISIFQHGCTYDAPCFRFIPFICLYSLGSKIAVAGRTSQRKTCTSQHTLAWFTARPGLRSAFFIAIKTIPLIQKNDVFIFVHFIALITPAQWQNDHDNNNQMGKLICNSY